MWRMATESACLELRPGEDILSYKPAAVQQASTAGCLTGSHRANPDPSASGPAGRSLGNTFAQAVDGGPGRGSIWPAPHRPSAVSVIDLDDLAVPGADAGEHHHGDLLRDPHLQLHGTKRAGLSRFVDGRPLFGPSKTLATAGVAALLGLGWKIGALIGIAAMASDLLASL